ncbi:hypothetical protein Bbelb_221570 [Branchiostoma belcheri]|nr:hypothetical protein Bbelb_221570 [Branchiostoma belcheri]
MCFPVEVGTRGFIICQSTWRMLGVVGVKGRRRREVTKRVAEEAERASRWLWVKSTDGEWNPKNLGHCCPAYTLESRTRFPGRKSPSPAGGTPPSFLSGSCYRGRNPRGQKESAEEVKEQ